MDTFSRDDGAGADVLPETSSDLVSDGAPHTHVMIVEDDRDTREVVKLLLEMEGIDVTEATDGYEALDRLHKLRKHDPTVPCAIVLDIMMPRCSGPEFRRRQLDDPLIADVPIIVLSAIADQLRMDDLHPFAKLAKPFDPDRLVDAVRRACHLSAES
jgi:CheY-like chemotaxis protein